MRKSNPLLLLMVAVALTLPASGCLNSDQGPTGPPGMGGSGSGSSGGSATIKVEADPNTGSGRVESLVTATVNERSPSAGLDVTLSSSKGLFENGESTISGSTNTAGKFWAIHTTTATTLITARSGRVSDTTVVSVDENQPPEAEIQFTPLFPRAGAPVIFDGTSSSDTDGYIVSYFWTFGDGAEGFGAQITHSYAAAGTYVVSLTVTDDGGASGTGFATITVVP